MGAPVILCGKTEQIGQGVIATLKPEYDVIHFVMSPASGAVQIPAILRGDQQPPSDSRLGSKDYSKPPVAVILGAAFDDGDTAVMMEAAAGIKPIPWLRPDLTKATPPVGPEYGKALVARIKVLLAQLEKEGKMNEETVQWY
ncbi:hypothetical protein F5B22DRAFT_637499 [Xylaria bambusicola]|uniref:uncharacterized protein n=1 Tax=Xylaria bambusicola TaxID=326684 RepID=UPI002007EAFC|nr:uncharacterized protein F5B22DRAFT_637499 [Xylaria bambusicola]KAI0512912.1 hypothetical protein F5B22DRAFT_637499 [Xylaria bambusicola]